jgi:hypothetical protein
MEGMQIVMTFANTHTDTEEIFTWGATSNHLHVVTQIYIKEIWRRPTLNHIPSLFTEELQVLPQAVKIALTA